DALPILIRVLPVTHIERGDLYRGVTLEERLLIDHEHQLAILYRGQVGAGHVEGAEFHRAEFVQRMQGTARGLEPEDAGGEDPVDARVPLERLLDRDVRLMELGAVDLQGLHGAAAGGQLPGESG